MLLSDKGMTPNKYRGITLPTEDSIQVFIYVSSSLKGLRQ